MPQGTLHSDKMLRPCAVKGQADLIFSGDCNMKKLSESQGIRMVGPATFLGLFARN